MKGRTNLPQEVVYVDETPSKPSIDGNFVWKANSTATSFDLEKVICGNGYFVAIAEEGTIVYSADAKNWNVSSELGFTILDIVFENNLFIMVGNYNKNGVIATSPDLLVWNIKNDYLLGGGTDTVFRGIMWNGNSYVLWGSVGGKLKLFTTNNLEEFTITDCGESCTVLYRVRHMIENNKMVIFVGTASAGDSKYTAVVSTNDGVNFVKSKLFYRETMSVFSMDGYFIRMSWDGTSAYTISASINGVNWETYGKTTTRCYGFVSANDFIIGIGVASKGLVTTKSYLLANNISDFVNGNVTIKEMNTVGADMISIVAHDKTIVAVGTGGCIFTASTEIPEEVLTLQPSINEQNYVLGTEKPKVIRIKAVNRSIDTNIKAENIKSGITILGVTGTL